MDIHASMFPDEIKVRDNFNRDSKYQVGIKLDGTSTIHITLDQAHSLWHELGAVLQSAARDVKFGLHAADSKVAL
jgi:hypothetical protein